MNKNHFYFSAKSMVYPLLLLTLLLGNSCDKQSEGPEGPTTDYTQLEGLIFPENGVSTINAVFYSGPSSTSKVIRRFSVKTLM